MFLLSQRPPRHSVTRGYFVLRHPASHMTIEEPRRIGVSLYPEQIERLEEEAEANPKVDSVSELVRLLVADYTGTLDQLRPPNTPDAENIQRLVESQQKLLEEIRNEIDREEDIDLDALIQLVDNVRDSQEEVSHELDQHDIY